MRPTTARLSSLATASGAIVLMLAGCQSEPRYVPDVAGMTVAEALAVLESHNMSVLSDPPTDPPYDELLLTGSEPAAGSRVSSAPAVDYLVFEPITATKVVDGQTIDLSTGDRVRLIGIAVPTSGECGAAEATAFLAEMVTGENLKVENPPGVKDYDESGNLLAEIGTDTVISVGYQLVSNGFADARSGGYTYPGEDIYIKAASEATKVSCEPAPEPATVDDSSSGTDLSAETHAWTCAYAPTMNDDWYDDVVCTNGTESVRPRLREWDDYVTESEMRASAQEYEDQLNAD